MSPHSFFRSTASRTLMASGGLALALAVSEPLIAAESVASERAQTPSSASVAKVVARQEIEYLRRLYARATDLIGVATPESIAEGRAIYHQIFTPDAEITVTSDGRVTLRSSGPEEWVDVVIEALGTRFTTTQHLIGTQLVSIESLPSANVPGKASMTSYLQAWHDSADAVDTFIGTYHDHVRYTPGLGWQIYRMNLEQVAHEVRQRLVDG